MASACGTARAKACESARTAVRQRSLPFSCARTCSCAAGSRPSRSAGVPSTHAVRSNPWKRLQQISYFSSIAATACSWSRAVSPVPAALGVGGQRPLQLVGEAQVVDDEAAGLVPEHAVDPRDGLHQPVAAHRLVDVHRVQTGRVEAGEPHVAHEHDPERIGGVAEPLGQRLAPGLVADVGLPVWRVRCLPRHHDLQHAAVVVVVPRRAQAHQLAVEVDADAPAHADHHRLAVHRLLPALDVLDDVAGDEGDALPGADNRFELRPLRLQLLAAVEPPPPR